MILDNLKKYDIVLASNSPRRKDLLQGLDIEYRVQTLPDLDESFPETLIKEQIPEYIANQKALAYIQMMSENMLLITADTIVWSEGQVLGKPKDSADAKSMLQQLSGKTHQVITGVCIQTKDKSITFTTTSDVTFSTLTQEEIDYYVDKYKPFDKAGSYGIQEWIGYIGVENISGSYFNVMGLPIQRLYKELKNF